MSRLLVDDVTKTDARALLNVNKMATISDIVAPSNEYIYASGANELTVVEGCVIAVGGAGIFKTANTILTAANLDAGSAFAVGKDYYVYICDSRIDSADEKYVISLNSTYPTGWNATNSRKIGGFHYGRCRKVDSNLQPLNGSSVIFGTGWESAVRGTQLKIGNDIAYANYIEDKIVNEDYSPAAVLGELKAQGKEGDFSVTVCVTTLYSYIDKGIFLKLSNKNLPVKKNKKRNYKKVQRQQKRAAAGESIDKRPKEIDTREEFGNWEMDSVLGKRGKSKNTLLVLTERKTRNEIIFKLPDHTDEAVVAALDRLERKWGADMFKRVFKTITVDNGSEFADAEGLQRSIINEGEKRTKVYYCHPYSSWERGTNEVTNKMIRRKIPKGTNFDDRTEEEVESIENWINGYPRKIHGYHSAGELFEEEVKQLA